MYLRTLLTTTSFLLIFLSTLRGQEVIVTDLSTNFGSISLEDMSMVSILNAGATRVNGSIQSTLVDLSGELVAELRSREITLEAGRQIAYARIPWTTRPTFGRSRFASIFSRLGVVAQGEFVLCFKFISNDGSVLGERCTEKSSSLDANFSLIHPFDKATIDETRPLLGWEDVARFGIRSALTYHLVLVEIEKGQSAAEALERNRTLVSQRGIRTTSLLYPLNAKQLESGHTYAWMVRAYADDEQLISSQQWVFTVGEPAAKSLAVANSSFAMLSTNLANTYYVFDDNICLGFDNNEGLDELDYRIIDLDDGDSEVANLPVITELLAGLNTLTIPTSSLGLQAGHTYRVEVSTPRKQYYFLHFRYTSL